MKQILVISFISILYAGIRAKHDSFVSSGEWKRWAFIEAVLVDIVTTCLVVSLFHLSWFQIPGLALSFAFIFWIFFDCACGHFRANDLLYIGESGWDAKARATFHYNRPFWGIKHPRALKYLLWKMFLASIIIASTISTINY